MTRAFTFTAAILGVTLVAAQPELPAVSRILSDAELTTWATDAAKEAASGEKSLDYAFNSRVRTKIPKYYDTPAMPPAVSASSDPAVSIIVAGPMAGVHSLLRERARRFEPIGPIRLLEEVVIIVDPTRIGAPSIEKIVVQRKGEAVSPIASSLAPKEFSTAMGAKSVAYSGSVTFPLAAFASGARVDLIAIPTTGRNITKWFSDDELARITSGFVFVSESATDKRHRR